MLDKYKLIGRSYDLLSRLYSGNAIQECRISHLNESTIHPDSKVLFAGAGQGRDAIHTAKLGANVTLIDISPTMMDSFVHELEKSEDKESLNIKPILGDVLKHEEKGKYDVVVANFFLTVFEKAAMMSQLEHLIKLVKPKGKLIIGDFSEPHGSLLKQATQQIYWYTAATSFFALTGNPIHQLYHYQEIVENKGLKILSSKEFPVLGQMSFKSILAEKQ